MKGMKKMKVMKGSSRFPSRITFFFTPFISFTSFSDP